jgi:hypothetical protein
MTDSIPHRSRLSPRIKGQRKGIISISSRIWDHPQFDGLCQHFDVFFGSDRAIEPQAAKGKILKKILKRKKRGNGVKVIK